jgi:hypothetical protein
MKFLRKNRIPILLCVGLLLFIAHYQNQPLLKYVFLPQIGTAILLGVVLFILFHRWGEIKKVGFGDKFLWIPLAVIAGSAIMRVIVFHNLDSLAGALFMAAMFGLYLVARIYGERALRFFMPVVIVGAVSIVVSAIINQHTGNSGLFNNYATASEFLVFGWLVSPRKHQWWLAGFVITGLFFTGAPEAIFYVAVIGLVILFRRDWSVKIALPLGVLGFLMVACSLAGITQVLWQRSFDMLNGTYVAMTDGGLTEGERALLLDESTDIRWLTTWRLQRPVSVLGYGVDVTNQITTEGGHIPHFIGLLVTDQLGPIAAVAWFVAMIAGIKRTKWKYGFLSLILFGVFQPFIWTLFAPYMWAMAGSASNSKVDTSYIFREVVATTGGA